MTVTGPSYNINAILKLSELELQQGLTDEASWHNTYKHSCYVFVGGLPYGLNEGDIATIFSQWGELIDIHLVRDKKTGTSSGFGFVGYENQKSTVLAVDNFNGYELLGRRIRVDHCENFRAPEKKKRKEEITVNDTDEYKPSGAEGKGYKIFKVTEAVKKVYEAPESAKSQNVYTVEEHLIRDADEQWAAEFEKQLGKQKKKKKKKFKNDNKNHKEIDSERLHSEELTDIHNSMETDEGTCKKKRTKTDATIHSQHESINDYSSFPRSEYEIPLVAKIFLETNYKNVNDSSSMHSVIKKRRSLSYDKAYDTDRGKLSRLRHNESSSYQPNNFDESSNQSPLIHATQHTAQQERCDSTTFSSRLSLENHKTSPRSQNNDTNVRYYNKRAHMHYRDLPQSNSKQFRRRSSRSYSRDVDTRHLQGNSLNIRHRTSRHGSRSIERSTLRHGSRSIERSTFRHGSQSRERSRLPQGSRSIERSTLRHGSRSIERSTFRHGSQSRERSRLPQGSRSIHRSTLRHGSRSIERSTLRHGSQSRERSTLRHGSRSIERSTLRHGSQSRERSTLRHGSRSIERTTLRHGSRSRERSRSRRATRSLERRHWRHRSRNREGSRLQHGSRSRERSSLRHGSRSIERRTLRHGSRSIERRTLRHGSRSRERRTLRHGSRSIERRTLRHGSQNIERSRLQHGS